MRYAVEGRLPANRGYYIDDRVQVVHKRLGPPIIHDNSRHAISILHLRLDMERESYM
jgi:hypothetical protein